MNAIVEARVAVEEVLRHIDAGDMNVRRKLDIRPKSRPSIQNPSMPAGTDATVAPRLSDADRLLVRSRRTQVHQGAASVQREHSPLVAKSSAQGACRSVRARIEPPHASTTNASYDAMALLLRNSRARRPGLRKGSGLCSFSEPGKRRSHRSDRNARCRRRSRGFKIHGVIPRAERSSVTPFLV